jgi:RHS repeat-associated protein
VLIAKASVTNGVSFYERDSETATDYAVNRQYNQSVGRFNQADPYQASGYLVDPQSWNRYSYTRNDSVNKVDALGLEDILTGYTVNIYAGTTILGGNDSPNGNPAREENIGGEVGDINKPAPCTNLDGSSTLNGFTQSVQGDRMYSAQELNEAVATMFGELSPTLTDQSRQEAEAIASVILNRSTAIANGAAPAIWGNSSSLSSVVNAGNGSQFNGAISGPATLRSIKDEGGGELFQGDRNCTRLQHIGAALAYLAEHPEARKPFYYFCARRRQDGSSRPLGSGEERIGNNDFSANPMECP